MEINATTKYDRSIYKEFTKFHLCKKNRFNIYFGILLPVLFAEILLLFLLEGFSEIVATCSIAFLIASLFFILMNFVLPSISYKFAKKMIDMELSFTFLDDEIIINSHNSEMSETSNLKYTILYKVYENPKYFYFYISKAQAIILCKNGIINGTDEQIREIVLKYLSSKKYKIRKK